MTIVLGWNCKVLPDSNEKFSADIFYLINSNSFGKINRNFSLGTRPFTLGMGPFTGGRERVGKPLV